jgi:crotonobetainyl-CoA:carnitine CoA-transferase CaiB-like acyl-CoA transferase
MKEFHSSGALSGVRVVDLSRVLGGPFCTQILGDYGAEVIKVESPQGDDTRAWGPPFAGDTAAYFIGLNRNKRGIVLDLNQQAERDALLRLLESADVLVENFKEGTLERWGIGQQDLAQRFPRLIHCRISGFGVDGPLGGLPGYDAVIQAMSGLMSINGSPDGPPVRIGVPVVDLATGLYAVIGILLALHERTTSGRGQFVDAALFDCGVSLLHPHLANYLASGVLPLRTGNAHPNITPYDTFRTGTVDLFVAVGNDNQFSKLCSLLGAPAVADDERFATNQLRTSNRDALKSALEELLASHDGASLAIRLNAAGVPAGPVLTLGQLVEHPHTHHREMIVDMSNYRGTGSPIKMSRTPATYRLPPPAFGEHNEEILKNTDESPSGPVAN